ncbi:hypothetical protein pgond44_01350 [Psychroflexus gondwanensis ACAM 44]|uniref:Lipoprotein n=1 Tax=Psychroflexus gondwanensis ACAM 44 TaxID=1189619 RepID=N1WUL5_9FLAO|nr:hypothetical protein [Psychroflexus gondwanensis]EMY82725.1 hypothetical protein pgond44_01350 [Psychroflexus gondwanensis ACAM 44]
MNRLLAILTLILLTSCGQSTKSDNAKQTDELAETPTEIETAMIDQEIKQEEKFEKVDCTDLDFISAEQRADSLLAFMEKAIDSSSASRIKWEQKFFCVFPNSFKGMQAVFGYDNDNGASPLYDYPKGANVIQYFSQLKSIPDSTYYDKYVRINIDGIWEADNIGEAFDFANRLVKDTKNSCKVLSTFSDKEIKSVFRFIFDGPHPKNKMNEGTYEDLKLKIDGQNKLLSQLLTESYEELMAEDDGHGH